ncbi:RNA-directed DNA polymerase, eukaryota, reverse transcriptase zinc-binding domain protein, partial [Tanacetum coccineum]
MGIVDGNILIGPWSMVNIDTKDAVDVKKAHTSKATIFQTCPRCPNYSSTMFRLQRKFGTRSKFWRKFRNLGTTLESKIIVRKLLNSVPKKFLPIVATIEQYQDLDEMSFEEAVGRLTAFEERIKSQDTLEANDQDKLLLASSNNQSHGKGRGKNFNKEAKESMKWKNSPNARGTSAEEQCLDKESDNVHLREEEYVYCNAYKEAVLDISHKSTQSYVVVRASVILVYPGLSVHDFKFEDCLKTLVVGSEDEVFAIDDVESLFVKKLDSQCAENLVRVVVDSEIIEAMFIIDDDKAAGPDDFTSKFFKTAWSIVVGDVCSAVKEFFSSGKILGEFNANLISLVPKFQTSLKVTNYRPIACCNVVYKCISKVITNRLKEGLTEIIDSNQSAFILGSQISDNILLSQEFMRGYGWKCGVEKQIRLDNRFVYHRACSKIKLAHLCFADDLLMLCHGDLISTCVLRRALDEFSMTSRLYPSVAKSRASFRNVPEDVKERILLAMQFREGFGDSLVIASVLSALHAKGDSGKGITSVAWKDICKPKSQRELELKPLKVMNEALMTKHLWNIVSDKNNAAWSFKQILKFRDKVHDYTGFKIGNGKRCSVWFYKWHSNGPLSKLISYSFLKDQGLDVNAKVADLIRDNGWSWPLYWTGRFDEVINAPVLVLIQDCEDKAIYCKDSHSHLFFSCDYPKEIWNKLKVMCKLDGLSDIWAEVVSVYLLELNKDSLLGYLLGNEAVSFFPFP